MARWYRAYEGTVTDAKLVEAAYVAGVSRSVVIATWHAILESCATSNNGGTFETSPRRIAATLVEPISFIDQVFAALTELGMIEEGRVLRWKDRQYESDRSVNRVREYRERIKSAGGKTVPPYDHGEVRARDNNLCVYCGSGENTCVDHMVPLLLGGDHGLDNLACACKRCNSGKAGRLPEQAGLSFANHVAEDRYRLAKARLVTVTSDLAHPNKVTETSVTVTVTSPETETETDTETKIVITPNGVTPNKTLTEAVDGWNDLAAVAGLAGVQRLTEPRRRALKARLAEAGGIEGWLAMLERVRDSSFLTGGNDRGWRADFDFVVKESNFTKIMEGKYDRKEQLSSAQRAAKRILAEEDDHAFSEIFKSLS